MDTSPTKAKESEFCQDTNKKLVTVQTVREPKRAVEINSHIRQGRIVKIPKLLSKIESAEHYIFGDSRRSDLSKQSVRSLREADWNKVKSLNDTFEASTYQFDKINQRFLFNGLFNHVRGHCDSLSNIYWSKPNFANTTYPCKFPSWKEAVRAPNTKNKTKCLTKSNSI